MAGGLTLLISGAILAFVRTSQPQAIPEAAPIDITGAHERLPPVQLLSIPARQAYKDGYVLFQKKQYEQAAERVRECIALEPTNAECRLLAGDAHAALGQVAQAEKQYTQFLKLDPQHQTAPRVGKLLLQYEKEAAKAELPPPATPVAEPQKVIPETPPPESAMGPANGKDYALAIRQARSAVTASQFKAAETNFRKALALSPSSLEAKEGLGFCMVMGSTSASAFREAAALLQEVVKQPDATARSWFALGMALQLTRREKEAEQAYKKYLSLEPTGRFAPEVRLALKQLDYR